MSITHEIIPRKGKDAEDGGGAAAAGLTPPPAAPVPLSWRGGKDGAACERPPSCRGAAGFTADELAELARADAEIDDAPDILTPEERALSLALDRQAAGERSALSPAGAHASKEKATARETPEQRAARLAKEKAWREAHREQLRAQNAAYNAAHRQERRDYQKAYDAAHREEINARRREKYAEKKRKEKEHGQ